MENSLPVLKLKKQLDVVRPIDKKKEDESAKNSV